MRGGCLLELSNGLRGWREGLGEGRLFIRTKQRLALFIFIQIKIFIIGLLYYNNGYINGYNNGSM